MQNEIKLEAAHLINAEHNLWVIVAFRDDISTRNNSSAVSIGGVRLELKIVYRFWFLVASNSIVVSDDICIYDGTEADKSLTSYSE